MPVDIFASSQTPLRFRELPYQFRARVAGESKLDSLVRFHAASGLRPVFESTTGAMQGAKDPL